MSPRTLQVSSVLDVLSLRCFVGSQAIKETYSIKERLRYSSRPNRANDTVASGKEILCVSGFCK